MKVEAPSESPADTTSVLGLAARNESTMPPSTAAPAAGLEASSRPWKSLKVTMSIATGASAADAAVAARPGTPRAMAATTAVHAVRRTRVEVAKAAIVLGFL